MEAVEKEIDVQEPIKIEKEKVELKRTLGLFGASSIVIGMMIGSGIFVSPKGVLSATGSVGLSLSVWAIAGIVQLGTALCYAELGTTIPAAGGAYTYLRLGIGNPIAFTYMLTRILAQAPGGIVIMLLTFAKYLVTLLPTCGSPVMLEKSIAAAAIATLAIVNGYSAKLAGKVAIFTTVGKLSALVVIIIGGILTMAKGTTHELGSAFSGTSEDPASLALALYSASFAYSGSENLNIVVEEIKNPYKNLPRAAVAGVFIVMVVYLLTNVSYLAVMTRAELLNAPAVGVVFGERVLGVAAMVIPISVMISTLGSGNNSMFSNSRIVFSAARDKNIPDVLSFISINQYTPLSALMVTAAMAIILLIPGDVGTLINYLAFIDSFFTGCVFVSLILFRLKKMKDVERPIKVPLIIPILMVLLNVYLFVAPLAISPKLEYFYVAAGVFGGSALLYIPFIHFGLSLPGYDHLVSWTQLIFQVCPPTKVVD